jgi:hypothetical protein
MDADVVVAAMRAGWLALTGMMLLSRAVFQAAGAERMRAFLDTWKDGTTRRCWGACTLLFAAVLVAGSAATRVGGFDLLLLGVLVAVLVSDGLVNVLPAGFRTFKDSVQERCVRRHAGTERAADRHLFGTVNLLLALAAAAMAALVVAYAPIAAGTVVVGVGAALVLTPLLLGLAVREGARR